MKILYMGTPQFAIAPMQKLIEHGHSVAAVVTIADKPQGRHMVLTPSPLKKAAIEMGIPVYTPQRLKDGEFESQLHDINPDLIVAVAYGKILPSYILDFPKYGCINLHGSILPRYRGAAPMQRAIMNGENEIGASVMYMAKGCDTGDIIDIYKIPLTDDMTISDVSLNLSENGGELLAECVDKLEKEGSLPHTKQDDSISFYAEKIGNEDAVLDFSESARNIHNRIRALCDSTPAFAILNSKKLKIVKSEIVEEESTNKDNAGKIIAFDKKGISVLCGRGTIRIKSLIPEGKKLMDAAAFVNGRGAAIGDILQKPEIQNL